MNDFIFEKGRELMKIQSNMSKCLYAVWYLFDVGNEKSPKLTKMKMKNNTFKKILSIRENNHDDITP